MMDGLVGKNAATYKCPRCHQGTIDCTQPKFCVHCGLRWDEECLESDDKVRFSEKFCRGCGAKNDSYLMNGRDFLHKLDMAVLFILATIGEIVVVAIPMDVISQRW